MRVLLVGGGGTVGGHVIPHLRARHELTVLDPAAPAMPGVTVVASGVTEPGALDALAGMDAVIHLAAVVPRGGQVDDSARVCAAYLVNVGSVHAVLTAARRHGVPRFVHISTLAVFRDYGVRPVDVRLAADADEPYGLSKRLAEEVCRTQAAGGGITAVSLRLAYPTPDADWPLWRPPTGAEPFNPTMGDGRPVTPLSAVDTAAAIEAALGYDGPHRGFAITGDPATVTGDDTASVLGWRPSRTPA
ncbi:NAD(P)-dependent oxidoreductase [Spongiactinospora sp. TRM90649]|uniref:NAD-dependent epimerase/dehydratase family protein n=1 Tax=Spongiactinospora sp. TRM90649 TaxID=3031114 RepID=UPI0023F70722|nr:NAD(P)-dependent oxidoreductase [Spongiactinospora sp. TRM90649]MDF5753714.1 NAD(P)-dependent oxidoreductase [Spongiactinospora sp. TRM90649]